MMWTLYLIFINISTSWEDRASQQFFFFCGKNFMPKHVHLEGMLELVKSFIVRNSLLSFEIKSGPSHIVWEISSCTTCLIKKGKHSYVPGYRPDWLAVIIACISPINLVLFLSKWSKWGFQIFNLLHNSQWINFPTHSFLVLFSFCASLQHYYMVNMYTNIFALVSPDFNPNLYFYYNSH